MAAILEYLECKSSAPMVRRVISVIPNRCGLKVSDKLAGRQEDPVCNAAMDRKPLSDVTAARPGYLSQSWREHVICSELNWTGCDRTATGPAEMAVVSQLRRLVKITQTMVKRRKKTSPSRGLTSGGPQPSVGSTAITTHILLCKYFKEGLLVFILRRSTSIINKIQLISNFLKKVILYFYKESAFRQPILG